MPHSKHTAAVTHASDSEPFFILEVEGHEEDRVDNARRSKNNNYSKSRETAKDGRRRSPESVHTPLISTLGHSNSKDENCSLKIEWLTTNEAAAYLKVSAKSLRNMVCNGSVPVHRLGRRLRFLVSELN